MFKINFYFLLTHVDNKQAPQMFCTNIKYDYVKFEQLGKKKKKVLLT